ncbi:hypothetical protein XELAEV_18030904mg [Xenopus laevis]|uniref:GIY-YIG domain-containing protein n=1 Tax=Xenopus laevis TaxID=8355 RepID=A0A974CMT4_XENLA|nr:hypothetical protein XELAEV_18030904mg [Xenopus laevis]
MTFIQLVCLNYEQIREQPPLFSYKRGSALKDILCPTEPKGLKRMDRIFKSNPNIGGVVQHPTKGYNINYATCNTEGVVYLLKCPYGKVYVGQTCRQIKARIKEYRGNIKNFKANFYTDTPVSRHFNQNRHNMSQLKWLVLEVVQIPQRGGDVKKILLQKETLWIKSLLDPLGLNEQWSVACFL